MHWLQIFSVISLSLYFHRWSVVVAAGSSFHFYFLFPESVAVHAHMYIHVHIYVHLPLRMPLQWSITVKTQTSSTQSLFSILWHTQRGQPAYPTTFSDLFVSQHSIKHLLLRTYVCMCIWDWCVDILKIHFDQHFHCEIRLQSECKSSKNAAGRMSVKQITKNIGYTYIHIYILHSVAITALYCLQQIYELLIEFLWMGLRQRQRQRQE